MESYSASNITSANPQLIACCDHLGIKLRVEVKQD